MKDREFQESIMALESLRPLLEFDYFYHGDGYEKE